MSSRDIVMIGVGFLGGYIYIRSQLDKSLIGKVNQKATNYGFPLY
jgi:hypothetical protein